MRDSLIEMQAFLENVRIPVRLASKTKTGWPMVVSLWFLHRDGFLYCATQKSAKIVSYLRNDARCAFEIAADQPPYCGIRGQARARIDDRFGGEMLEQLLIRYLGGIDKRAIAKGGQVLREEVIYRCSILAEGGYIPSCDHGVPSDIPWHNFVEYSRLLAQLTGWL